MDLSLRTECVHLSSRVDSESTLSTSTPHYSVARIPDTNPNFLSWLTVRPNGTDRQVKEESTHIVVGET